MRVLLNAQFTEENAQRTEENAHCTEENAGYATRMRHLSVIVDKSAPQHMEYDVISRMERSLSFRTECVYDSRIIAGGKMQVYRHKMKEQ